MTTIISKNLALRSPLRTISKTGKPSVHITESLHNTALKKQTPKEPESVCDRTGAILGGSFTDTRASRYKLQRIAKRVLQGVYLPNGNPFRVTSCLSSMAPDTSSVIVLKGVNSDVCHFSGLMRCGSVWNCPVCSAALTQHRAQEIVQAQEKHRQTGGITLMLTYTHSHKVHTKLSETMEKLPIALQKMRNSRQYKSVLARFGYIGLIRSLETTYSDRNGFHVHTHELLFFDASIVVNSMIRDEILQAWRNACLKVGLGLPSKRRGLTVKTAWSPSDYLAKFGVEQKWGSGAELSKSHVKTGYKSLAIFDFLRLCDTQDQKQFDKYSKLFQEFALNFHGKRQIYWTNGLKARFGVTDTSDEEILSDSQDQAEVVAHISRTDWIFLRGLFFDARPIVLRWAERGGYHAVDNYLSMLRELYSSPS